MCFRERVYWRTKCLITENEKYRMPNTLTLTFTFSKRKQPPIRSTQKGQLGRQLLTFLTEDNQNAIPVWCFTLILSPKKLNDIKLKSSFKISIRTCNSRWKDIHTTVMFVKKWKGRKAVLSKLTFREWTPMLQMSCCSKTLNFIAMFTCQITEQITIPRVFYYYYSWWNFD